MNTVVAHPAPAQALGLVPTTMGEAIRLAELMASAKLVPAALQKSPADCLMVIQQAIRWQMDPFAVAQECSVIQSKLMHSGKLVAAVVNARGNLTSRLSFEYSGEGENRTITVSGQLQGEAGPRVVQVTLKDARTQNRVWQTQPDQQLAYHGTRVWARRHTPELMLGVNSPEEFDEPKWRVGVANPDTYKEDLRRDLNAQPIEAAPPPAETPAPIEDIEPYELEHTENSEDEWKRWGNDLFAYIKAAKTYQRIDQWIVANGEGFEALKHYDVGKFNRLRHMIQAVQDAKAKAARDEPQ